MLTHRQLAVLRYIDAEIKRTGGVAPSVREIATAVGMNSTYPAKWVVDQLVDRGFIERIPGRAMALRVLRMPSQSVRWFRFDDEAKELKPFDQSEQSVRTA